MPASWVGPNSEHDPRPKITKVLTRQKLKITNVKLLKLWAKPKSSKVFKVIWPPETLLPDHFAARRETERTPLNLSRRNLLDTYSQIENRWKLTYSSHTLRLEHDDDGQR